MKYKKHIFVCTNERTDGRKSCGHEHGMLLVDELKKRISADKLNAEVRAQKAGCFDICPLGPALVVYPEGVFYKNVEVSDIAEIYESHIKNNTIVERLKIDF